MKGILSYLINTWKKKCRKSEGELHDKERRKEREKEKERERGREREKYI